MLNPTGGKRGGVQRREARLDQNQLKIIRAGLKNLHKFQRMKLGRKSSSQLCEAKTSIEEANCCDRGSFEGAEEKGYSEVEEVGLSRCRVHQNNNVLSGRPTPGGLEEMRRSCGVRSRRKKCREATESFFFGIGERQGRVRLNGWRKTTERRVGSGRQKVQESQSGLPAPADRDLIESREREECIRFNREALRNENHHTPLGCRSLRMSSTRTGPKKRVYAGKKNSESVAKDLVYVERTGFGKKTKGGLRTRRGGDWDVK